MDHKPSASKNAYMIRLMIFIIGKNFNWVVNENINNTYFTLSLGTVSIWSTSCRRARCLYLPCQTQTHIVSTLIQYFHVWYTLNRSINAKSDCCHGNRSWRWKQDNVRLIQKRIERREIWADQKRNAKYVSLQSTEKTVSKNISSINKVFKGGFILYFPSIQTQCLLFIHWNDYAI